MIRFLLLFLFGFSISTYSQESGEKLFKAIFEHNLEVVKKIVEKDKSQANYIRRINESFYIPVLMQAVMNNEYEISKFLIESGADVNKIDGFKMTCLMWAAANQNIELTKLLLKSGANKNVKDDNGMTALKAAKETKNNEIIELLK
ncbi:ankyrin repeat domain-containing protein [Flavobacterium sp. F-65]|uniref:Ankyrin repeat domain-containing protein n=1 Tax=Flavobacterium pisciphilum TaxID=2893755 RepID=A0ABS8N0S2_9FLAO|nr:ankyrin repeat domain-containing protein [Flavobacterium sp. F-65]MCC9073695.1 ankyrin repeat domain-containing protein [Flavobacterium sp. F-65]